MQNRTIIIIAMLCLFFSSSWADNSKSPIMPIELNSSDGPDQISWITDVQVSSRENVRQACLAHGSGNLFVVLRIVENGNSMLTVNLSGDKGLTWAETYVLEKSGEEMNDVDALVYDGALYVAYTVGSSQQSHSIRKFSLSDGVDLGEVYAATYKYAIKELSLTKELQGFLPDIFYALLFSNGAISAGRFDPTSETVTPFTSNSVTDADRGLDICVDYCILETSIHGAILDDGHVYVTYYSKSTEDIHQFCILEHYLDQWDSSIPTLTNNTYIDSVDDHTSIVACATDVMMAFECHTTTLYSAVPYRKDVRLMYKDGGWWKERSLGIPPPVYSEVWAWALRGADLATRHDEGIAIGAMRKGQNDCMYRYDDRFNTSSSISFNPSVRFNEINCDMDYQMEVEAIPPRFNTFLTHPAAYGFVWISSSNQQAYFDRTDPGIHRVIPDDWIFMPATSNNATIILPLAAAPTIGNDRLSKGDVIGVFTPDGLCCGWQLWEQENLAITAWGDDDQTPEIDGFRAGEKIHFRVYQIATGKELPMVEAAFQSGDGTYQANGLFTITGFNAIETHTLSLDLKKGWNMISMNVTPSDLKVESIMQPVADKLEIMKNDSGFTYAPQFGINTIGDWNVLDGYYANFNQDTTLNVTGPLVDPTSHIRVLKGWNMVSYLPNVAFNAEFALSNLLDKLVIAKDEEGQVYIPIYKINQIGTMNPGQGYRLNMDSTMTLIYPQPFGQQSHSIAQADETDFTPPVHFEFQAGTGANATIIIPAEIHAQFSDDSPLMPGDEIGVFNSAGVCCGATVWQGENTALTIWGDDARTEEIDGLNPGEACQFRIWRNDTGREYPVTVKFENDGRTRFQTDDIAILNSLVAELSSDIDAATEDQLPTEFHLFHNYPNPFNPSTTIAYDLPELAQVRLAIFNLQGEQIRQLVREHLPAGQHSASWDGRDAAGKLVATGMYIYRIQIISSNSDQSNFTASRKLLFLK